MPSRASPPSPRDAPAASPAARASRLSREARIEQLLDTAARLLMEDGFTEVSMERLGREAGVSKPLVYKYFPSRNDLLRALLERENRRTHEHQVGNVRAARGDFEQAVRLTTRANIVNLQQRGALLNKLWAEPAVVRALALEDQQRREAESEYFVRKLVTHYELPADLARAAVGMQMAMAGAAARHFADGRLDPDSVTDLCLTMIFASLDALQRRYGRGTGKKGLRKVA